MAEPARTEHQLADIAHDPDAFELFYRSNVELVGRFIARRVDDPYLAADLTADVFLLVIDSAHTYRPERGSVVGWMFGVAYNVLAAERRRARRETAATRRIAGRRLLEPADIARIEERIDAENAAREIYRALADVPDPTRRLLELVAVDGLAVTEAAAALGMSPIAARVRLHRVRKHLRDQVALPTSTGEAHGYA
ncbi:RNA polymerase sigma-70 factor (ECF subfamily) [Actinoplanes lutulentus]|uniref:RNA polymerase sigma-70 factor (ECF subfamily) n=1 Tax=Actinoplanes lutulentus TaxID=1287878 RepID=A0A327ZLA1_9ACTN|nr:sigma-70 family RNA polymerase sigma factor [Actinoplanes lutulentus]MBB2940765.1 RNA polymerase sigma-70 factor (ECF subfamily) [Actinoplanes lutulentus]RAK43075.1 RNA polymerase sigma-70 factor (ECF subfamily) [Actinoplanes lutulentus]